jgi:serine/threonine protein kinase
MILRAMSEGAPTDPLTTRTAGPRATAAGEHASETLADAERIEAASMIGRFTILDIVGAGGMGQVYAAYDPQLDRRVALKVLHTPDDEVARQRLVREAQALARLSHPNVVGVHEVGAHEGRVFVAMEFVEGETLKDWARSHAPGEPDRMRRALELLLHAGRGLAAAHAAGLVHRDVKPGNILVGRDGRVRVADFGLARADEDAPAGTLERSL